MEAAANMVMEAAATGRQRNGTDEEAAHAMKLCIAQLSAHEAQAGLAASMTTSMVAHIQTNLQALELMARRRVPWARLELAEPLQQPFDNVRLTDSESDVLTFKSSLNPQENKFRNSSVLQFSIPIIESSKRWKTHD